MYYLISRKTDPDYGWAVRNAGREVHLAELDITVNELLKALNNNDNYYQKHESEWSVYSTPILAVSGISDFVAQLRTLILLGVLDV